MKALRFRLIQIAILCFIIWLPDTASARVSVSLRFGSGHQSSRCSYRHDNRRRSQRSSRYHRSFKSVRGGWRSRYYHRPQVRTIVVGSGCYYRTEPYYVVTTSPTVIEKRVVVDSTSSPQVVQPEEEDKDTQALFKALRYRKSELLKKLQTGDKQHRLEAIKELAGFSFDDQVRQALENILLSDPDPELRKQVAQAFGKVNNTKALPALEKARVEDSDEDVRKEADNAIKKIEAN